MTRIRRILRASPRERALALEAASEIVLAYVHVKLLPSPRLIKALGGAGADNNAIPVAPKDEDRARDIAQAIDRAARLLPIRAACLPRALAARRMMTRRRVPSLLSLGLKHEPGGGLSAHAWLRVGEVVVTGGEISPTFTPVQHFS